MGMLFIWLQAWLGAAVLLSGAGEAESMDESVLERFEAMHARPVPLNLASRSRLLSSGLLTAYQVASLTDYRLRYGDILSVEELALVDGFGREVAEALVPFVSFRSASLPGVADSIRSPVRQHLEFRTKGPAFKYRLCLGERAEAGFSWKGAFPAGAYGVYYGDGRLGKVVAGRFNVRFGQGLAVWSGFVIEDLLTPSSFVKKASGISPTHSYNPESAFLGAAADFAFGRWDLSVYAADSGSGVNAGWSWRSGRAGLSVILPDYRSPPRISTDVRWNPRGVQLFGELAFAPAKGHVAAVGGLLTPIGEHLQAALRLSVLPSAYTHKKYGEYSAVASIGFTAGKYVQLKGRTGFGASEIRHRGALAASYAAMPIPGEDPRRYMLKIKAEWRWRISPSCDLQVRASERLRNYASERSRTEVRADFGWSDGIWCSRCRLDGVWCDGGGILAYAEGGYSGSFLSFSARCTIFRTAAWASRIYSYERDAPGNFNVPAYYGEGWAATFLVGARQTWRYATLKTWARLSVVQKKSGNAVPGLSMQVQVSI